MGAFPQRGDGETVGWTGLFSVMKGGTPRSGTDRRQGVGLELERCIFSWDGPGGLTWEGDRSIVTSQMQRRDACSSLSPAPPGVAGRPFHGGPEVSVCLSSRLSIPLAPGAEFGPGAAGRKGSDRGTALGRDGDQAQSPGWVASALSLAAWAAGGWWTSESVGPQNLS